MSSHLAVQQPHVGLVFVEVHLALGANLSLQRSEASERLESVAPGQDLAVDVLQLRRKTLRTVGAVSKSEKFKQDCSRLVQQLTWNSRTLKCCSLLLVRSGKFRRII